MSKQKGFTLVEMMGIIILLTVIMLVVAPTMINTLKNNNTKRFEAFKDNLKIATENYIVQAKLISEYTVEVKLTTLLEEKYIDEIPSIPKDDPLAEDGNKLLAEAYIIATKTDTGYTYELCKDTTTTCESI